MIGEDADTLAGKGLETPKCSSVNQRQHQSLTFTKLLFKEIYLCPMEQQFIFGSSFIKGVICHLQCKLTQKWLENLSRFFFTRCTLYFSRDMLQHDKRCRGRPQCTSVREDKYVHVSSLRNRCLAALRNNSVHRYICMFVHRRKKPCYA